MNWLASKPCPCMTRGYLLPGDIAGGEIKTTIHLKSFRRFPVESLNATKLQLRESRIEIEQQSFLLRRRVNHE